MNDDLIRLEDAIEAIASRDITDGYEPVFSGRQVIALLNDLDSVTPQEPKTGHWVRISMDKYTQHAKYYYKCSECGEDVIGEHKFCPNCGCRMQESEE